MITNTCIFILFLFCGHAADCIPLCFHRCKLHLRKILCVTACMTCCDRCKCVPPGFYGNREKCGKCYLYMSTHHNKYKCP